MKYLRGGSQSCHWPDDGNCGDRARSCLPDRKVLLCPVTGGYRTSHNKSHRRSVASGSASIPQSRRTRQSIWDRRKLKIKKEAIVKRGENESWSDRFRPVGSLHPLRSFGSHFGFPFNCRGGSVFFVSFFAFLFGPCHHFYLGVMCPDVKSVARNFARVHVARRSPCGDLSVDF